MIKSRILKFTLVSISAMTLLISGQLLAVNVEVEKQILAEFQTDFERVETFANENKKPFDPNVLMEFIESNMMPRWSAELTIRAIVGKERWKEFKPEEKQELIKVYAETMKRYLYETFQQYKGQKSIAEKVELHSNLKKGWLAVKLLVPDSEGVSFDLKVYNRNGHWVIYDFRFQGVSFVQLKSLDYFLTLKINGAEGLINKLKEKNELFYKSLEVKS